MQPCRASTAPPLPETPNLRRTRCPRFRPRPQRLRCLLGGVAAVSARVVSTGRCVQRQRKLHPGVDYEQDPWREVPWGDLPHLAPEQLRKLQQLQLDMEDAYGRELLEPWEIRKTELEEIFRPNRCACTYGELDHFGVARLLQAASLGPGHRFVDVGSGLGKLVVAAACVTADVECCGVEISPFRHERALEGLEKLKSSGAISASEAARVKLLSGNCADDAGVPGELLEATHLILTMRRSTKAVNQLCQALKAHGPLPNGQPRILWSITKHIKMRQGMDFQRRFMIDGFELPQSLGPDDRRRAGKVTEKMVLHEYSLDF